MSEASSRTTKSGISKGRGEFGACEDRADDSEQSDETTEQPRNRKCIGPDVKSWRASSQELRPSRVRPEWYEQLVDRLAERQTSSNERCDKVGRPQDRTAIVATTKTR